VEENERLRAILGEWSARAAKVLVFFLTLPMYPLHEAIISLA